ncbi:ferritin-like domain-containing protein [Spirosoma fluviale]|uniref:Ferritin-like n=1 Tax=Spirosoma fluviale TaxID=1597977 RepID=A0A286G422_9BACT|nr:ferritin-like protein [Spirosoma fluviale]SOD89704.1 Ferritin-like [Spirosoma fluviale]
MIQIKPEIIHQIKEATSLEHLFDKVQMAIELEHATIPPYLTAMFSLKPGANLGQRKIIYSVVVEEMMHMSIAANILNALGGSPQINNPQFIPSYPGPLPMGIGQGLQVGLEAYSTKVVEDVFMKIEEPEHPLVFKALFESEEPQYSTIGEFYMALQNQIIALAPDILPGDSTKQVTSPSFFKKELLFPIIKKEDAINAINVIIEQGEGTTKSPYAQGEDGEFAHYYRFEELSRGKTLVADSTATNGFSFSGADIAFDHNGVYSLYPNTKTASLPEGSEVKILMNNFNTIYSSLLFGLHDTFNGKPENLGNTIGLMFDLRLTAEKLCATPFPGKPGYNVGPSFEFFKPGMPI